VGVAAHGGRVPRRRRTPFETIRHAKPGGLGGGVATNPSQSATPLASAELYYPSAGTFRATGSMTTARQEHTATSLPSGMVLFVGGLDIGNASIGSAELYDPRAGTFATTSNMTTRRYRHTATWLPSGPVLIAGGWIDAYTDLASAELYE
jgi:hypothetical protein